MTWGLDLSTAISLFLRQSVREQAIPFKIEGEIPNSETEKALAEYEKMKTDKSTYKRYDSFNDLLEEFLRELPKPLTK